MSMDLADHIKFLRAKYYDGGDTLKTINQLVELVAEMRDAGKELTRFYDGKGSYNGDVEKLNQRRALTKADALLTKLGEV